MRLPTVPTKYVVDHLNTTYFNKVWNAPDDHGRSNFQLVKVAERIQTGAVPVAQSVVGLPTTDAVYAVYKTTYRGLNRFSKLPDETWVPDSYLTETFGVIARAYDGNGRMCPIGSVWLRYMPISNTVLVAISGRYTKKCTGTSYPNLYMTVMYDTTRSTPVKNQTFEVSTFLNSSSTPAQVTTKINQAKATCPLGTTVMVNGWVYDPDHVPALAHGDIVCISSDPDIIGVCDVTVDDNNTGYYSEKYGEYRELVHIPKALNPNGVIITTDTLTFNIVDADTHRGVYGHRVNPHAIESVTHNDFSVTRNSIQSFAQALEATNVILRLYVRLPTEPNYLNDDANHLSDLYTFDDVEINKQLLNLSTQQITEWTAAHLEQSAFINLMYKFDGFNASTILAEYADAVGYYDLATTLGQQMRFYTYKGAQVQIIKPARLYGYECDALVYINGLKVREGDYTISNYSQDAFKLGFKASSGIAVGDRVALYICEAGYKTAVYFNPTSAEPSITLPNEDYELFQIFTYDDPVAVWEDTATKGYKRVPLAPAEYTVTQTSNSEFVYEVKSKNYNKNYCLIPKFGMVNAVYDISDRIADDQAVWLDLTTMDEDAGYIPMIGYAEMEVYLNGHRLIEGIDYEAKPYLGPAQDTLQNVLVLSNCDFLDLDGGENIIEVVIHGDRTVSEDTGYAIENKLYREKSPMVWGPSSGRVFVNGELIEKVTEAGNIMITQNDVPNGAPFLVQYSLSYGAGKLLRDFSPTEDLNLRGRIEHIQGIVPPTYPDVVVVDHLYALFSPFLAQIVSDVGNGVIHIVDEPNNERFLKQFAPYKELLNRDATIGASTLLDRRFITLAAHYANYAVTDPEQMLRTQRLVDLVLTPSELSIKEVLL